MDELTTLSGQAESTPPEEPAAIPGKHRRIRLRAATATCHAALEAAVGPLDGMPAWGGYIAGLHRFRAAVEPALPAACARLLPGAVPALIASSLARDLGDLGLPVLPVAAAARTAFGRARAAFLHGSAGHAAHG